MFDRIFKEVGEKLEQAQRADNNTQSERNEREMLLVDVEEDVKVIDEEVFSEEDIGNDSLSMFEMMQSLGKESSL